MRWLLGLVIDIIFKDVIERYPEFSVFCREYKIFAKRRIQKILTYVTGRLTGYLTWNEKPNFPYMFCCK